MGLDLETSTEMCGNNCWILFKENKADTLIFKINSSLTLLSYTIFRVINYYIFVISNGYTRILLLFIFTHIK